MKKILSVMLLAVTLILVSGQDNQAEANWQVVGISTYLSIREDPSIYFRELTRVPNGTILGSDRDDAAFYPRNGFVHVNYGYNSWGWAAERYLKWVY